MNNLNKSAPRGVAKDGGKVLRTSTITTTAGPIGASFAVQHKDWKCALCQNSNLGRHRKCLRCREGDRPEATQVWSDAMVANASGGHNWREAVDYESKQIYYYNTETNETTWQRPEVMGAAPLSTGWFGRGKNAADQSKYEINNALYLTRPAVVQAKEEGDLLLKRNTRLEGAGEYNIWFGRFQGQHWSSAKEKGEKAEARCNVSLHAGLTKANDLDAFFCLWFSHGVCTKGADCRFIHRVPVVADCLRLEKDPTHDVFGRNRRTERKDDQGGVSCLHEPSRTLYVGALVRGPYEDDMEALKECLERHFGEFGEVENINVIWRLGIAFVRYRFRSNAEFAIEAMDHQSMDNEECLNLRWATEDPNPLAKAAAARSNADAVVGAIRSQLMNGALGPQAPLALPAAASKGEEVVHVSKKSKVDE